MPESAFILYIDLIPDDEDPEYPPAIHAREAACWALNRGDDRIGQALASLAAALTEREQAEQIQQIVQTTGEKTAPYIPRPAGTAGAELESNQYARFLGQTRTEQPRTVEADETDTTQAPSPTETAVLAAVAEVASDWRPEGTCVHCRLPIRHIDGHWRHDISDGIGDSHVWYCNDALTVAGWPPLTSTMLNVRSVATPDA